jgi:UDP-N-acetyl-D-glucosamine dehydrogenase
MSIASPIVLPNIAQERFDRLEARSATIGVIGLGYAGLPLCLLLAEAGFTVTGFDIDATKVGDLEAGRSYIFRIPSAEISSARQHGFVATTDFSHLSNQDAIIICVPTPLTEHREPDLSYVGSTAKAAAPWIREGQLVVLESTTYPGTTEELLIPILEAFRPSMGSFTSRSLQSEKTLEMKQWRGAIFPRLWGGTKQLPRNLQPFSIKPYLPSPSEYLRPVLPR